MSGYRRSFPKGTSERMCALMSEARNISELKRAQCIYFRSEHGLPPQQIADMVGFDVGTVRNLHSAFLGMARRRSNCRARAGVTTPT